MKKNKEMILPNECSMGRWIATMVVGFLLGTIAMLPLQIPFFLDPELGKQTFMGITLEPLFSMISFACFFGGMVLALKWIAKTSLKDFILGVGGTLDKKTCLILFAMQALGITLASLLTISNVYFRGVELGNFLVLLVLMVPLTFLQTTWEELIFRGVFLRWACKNEMRVTKKAILGGVLSSVFFGLVHISNPEISSMTGLELVLGVICYILPGAVFYAINLRMGSLIPGIILHFTNNYLLFTIVSAEVTAMPMPTLLVDGTQQTPLLIFASTLLVYVPAVVYSFFFYPKRARA